MMISIVIPVYNEEKTIAKVLQLVNDIKIIGVKKEIIVVNDGSSDNTEKIINDSKKKLHDIRVVSYPNNQGKGVAVRNGIAKAKGDYVIIQDADLEYHPSDIKKLVRIVQDKKSDVVFGTRLKRMPNFQKDERTVKFFTHYMGNKFLSLLTSLLYGQWVTDMETGYKLIPKSAFTKFTLHAKGFEFEPEITAKLLKAGFNICEVPISTNPRGYKEGKKLHTIKDGTRALYTLLKYRFVS